MQIFFSQLNITFTAKCLFVSVKNQFKISFIVIVSTYLIYCPDNMHSWQLKHD